MDPKQFLNNPMLKNIDNDKLKFLMEMASQEKGSTPKDMAANLMAASATAKEKGTQFERPEMDLIVDALKQNMSDADKQKADLIMNMMKKRR